VPPFGVFANPEFSGAGQPKPRGLAFEWLEPFAAYLAVRWRHTINLSHELSNLPASLECE